MSKFKVGDKVKLKSGELWGAKQLPVVTIRKIDTDGAIWVEETYLWASDYELELVEPCIEDLRKELLNAINTLARYGIEVKRRGHNSVTGDNCYGYSTLQDLCNVSKEAIVKKVLPLTPNKTPVQLKLEELEKKQREIAEEMKKLSQEISKEV